MKGAVEVLTRYLAKELGSRCKMIASQIALGRVGVADDIGGAVASLLTGENRWINAQRIEVSGGMFI
jgi:NAD(P)-dependent dehydrogenase (short-subunit alcohol dehydrogenase family)